MPCTRAITGCGSSVSVIIMRLQASNSSRCHAGVGVRPHLLQVVARAEALAARRRSPRRARSGRPPTRRARARSAASMSRDNALKRSPRFIVSVRTPSRVSRQHAGDRPRRRSRAFMAAVAHSIAAADPARSRSRNFWILPVDVFGSSPNTTLFGALNRARCAGNARSARLGDRRARLQLDERARRLAPLAGPAAPRRPPRAPPG